MSMAGMIAIGNGEKCPFCELIIDKDTDTLKHLMDKHPKELSKELYNE